MLPRGFGYRTLYAAGGGGGEEEKEEFWHFVLHTALATTRYMLPEEAEETRLCREFSLILKILIILTPFCRLPRPVARAVRQHYPLPTTHYFPPTTKLPTKQS